MVEKQVFFSEIAGFLAKESGVPATVFKLDDSPLKSYGVDSLSLMQTVTAIEDHFDIELDEMEIFDASSFEKLTALVVMKVSAKLEDKAELQVAVNS